MTQTTEERKKLLTKACKLIFDELEDSVKQMREFDTPSIRDDFDKLHAQLLFYSSVEMDLSHLYRETLKIKHEVDTSRARSKDALEDAKMEAVTKPTFRNPLQNYQSRPETEGKLRSLTFEEHYDVSQWDKLYADVQYLVDTLKSYQMDANKQRRDIDSRLKIISFKI